MAQPVRGSDVVVAIVGGTLLAVALNRPRIRGRGKRAHSEHVEHAEIALTGLAFFIGGYAAATLLGLLAHFVDPPAQRAVTGAAVIFLLYGLLIHHEPFDAIPSRIRWRCLAGVVVGAASLGYALGEVVVDRRWGGYPWWAWTLAGLLFLLPATTQLLAEGGYPISPDDPGTDGRLVDSGGRRAKPRRWAWDFVPFLVVLLAQVRGVMSRAVGSEPVVDVGLACLLLWLSCRWAMLTWCRQGVPRLPQRRH